MSGPYLLFDRRFIDDGKYLCNPASSQCVEGMLMEDDAPSTDWYAEERTDRGAVEPKARGNVISVRHDEIGVKVEVGDVSVVFLEHCAIAAHAERAAIADDVSGNEG